jgi:fatty acid desaturase
VPPAVDRTQFSPQFTDTITGSPTERDDGGFSELSRQVKQAGLLDRRSASDKVRMGVNALLLAIGWTAFMVIGDSWYQLIVAVYLALVLGQIGFVAHDIGHRQTHRSRRLNDFFGLINANLFLGMSYGWWIDKHTRHHTRPNQEGRDPDIGTGIFVWTTGQARVKRGPGRLLARYQAVLFLPMLLLEGLHLQVAGIRALPARTSRQLPKEAILLGLHIALYVAALLFVLSPVHALVFLAVNQGLLGLYLGSAFAPNHKGMPVLPEGDATGFLERQVITARNVRGGIISDFALGGLNYQIEHHLFPSMPRRNLRRSQPLVKAFCERHNLSYNEQGFVASYAQVLRHLHAVGAPTRGRTTA